MKDKKTFEENSKEIAKLMTVIEDICADAGCSIENAELVLLAQVDGNPANILDFIEDHKCEINDLYYGKYEHDEDDEDDDDDYDDEDEKKCHYDECCDEYYCPDDDSDCGIEEERPTLVKDVYTGNKSTIYIPGTVLDEFDTDEFTVVRNATDHMIELIPGDCVEIKKHRFPDTTLVHRHNHKNGCVSFTGRPLFKEYEHLVAKVYKDFGMIEITKKK